MSRWVSSAFRSCRAQFASPVALELKSLFSDLGDAVTRDGAVRKRLPNRITHSTRVDGVLETQKRSVRVK